MHQILVLKSKYESSGGFWSYDKNLLKIIGKTFAKYRQTSVIEMQRFFLFKDSIRQQVMKHTLCTDQILIYVSYKIICVA